MVTGPDSYPRLIKGGSYFFRPVTIHYKRQHTGFVGRSADKPQSGDLSKQAGSILQQVMLVLADKPHADAGDVVYRRTQPDGISDIASAGFKSPRRLLVAGMFKRNVTDHVAATLPGGCFIQQILLSIQHANTRW